LEKLPLRFLSSFNVFSGDGEFDIIIHFNKCVAHRVREKRWPGQQQLVELPNGDVQLHQKLTSHLAGTTGSL
jgi:hypothetical protein